VSDEDRSTGLEMGVGRIEAFSDAVMAVIITIMAFELRLHRDLLEQPPSSAPCLPIASVGR